MYGLKHLAQLAAVAAFVAIAVSGAARAASIHPGAAGECGEYKYWHNGHCVDAREKPGKNWTAGVYI